MASNSIINSSSADQRWVYQISKIFEEENVIDNNPTTPTVCICGVPKIFSATKPEAYSPQTIALGPYHHFRPELYEMERHKLSVAKQVLKMRHSINVQYLIARLKELESTIRACYHKYIDLDGDSLAWIIAIDGLFLLGILNGLANENHTGYSAGFAGSKLMQDAIHKDVVMLENQIPMVALKAISDIVHSSSDGKDGGLRLSSSDPLGNRGLSSDDNVNEVVLGSTGRNGLSPSPKPYSKSEEESGDDGVLPRVLARFCEELSPLKLGRIVRWATCGKTLDHVLGVMYLQILSNQSFRGGGVRFHKMSEMVSCTAFFGQCMGLPGAELIGKLFEYINRIIGLVSFGEGNNSSNGTKKEMKIPSVSELCRVGVKFSSLRHWGINEIRFDIKAGTLHLPVITLKPTSEVVLRNLVAYEALYKRFPTLGSYMDLMGGIIGTAEDARLLREKDIVEGPLSDGEVADLFNGMSMSKSIVSPGRECNIKYTMELVNKYYNKTWKVKAHRFMKNYVYSFWKGITLLSTIMLVMLLSVQLFCDLNGCTSIYSVLLKEDHAGAYPT